MLSDRAVSYRRGENGIAVWKSNEKPLALYWRQGSD